MTTTVILSAIIGIIIWQIITTIIFALTKENEEVGLVMGMGIALLVAQYAFWLYRAIKWKIFAKRHKRYEFVDTTAKYCPTRDCKFAKPSDMKVFNFDQTATHYVIEHEIVHKHYAQPSDILTPEKIENGWPGFDKEYANRFKKGE